MVWNIFFVSPIFSWSTQSEKNGSDKKNNLSNFFDWNECKLHLFPWNFLNLWKLSFFEWVIGKKQLSWSQLLIFFCSFSNFFFEKDSFKKVSPREVLILIFLHYYATQPKIGPPCKKWGAFSVFYHFFCFFQPPAYKKLFLWKISFRRSFSIIKWIFVKFGDIKKKQQTPLKCFHYLS